MDTNVIHQRRWLTLGVLCLSLFIIVMDNTVLNVALPTLVDDLGATNSQLQWVVDAYTLVFAGLLLTAGSLGDRFGRKRALNAGLLLFAAASVLAATSTTAGALIRSRALLGVGGALIMPATLSILTNVFTDPKERGRAIGMWAAISGLAIAAGPVTGGWLLEHFWWGSVFLLNVPVVLGAVVAGRWLVPDSRDPSAPRLDPVGALLSIGGLVTLVWALIEAPHQGWTDGVTVGAFAVGAVLMAVFIAWEVRSDHPMLDVRFFRNPRFSAASAAITLAFFGMFGSIFLISQYLQFVLGYSALEAGVHMLPVAAATLVAAPSSARLVEVVGTKLVVVAGLVSLSSGLAVVTTFTATSGYGPVALSMVLVGLGMGLTMAPGTESIMGSLPPSKAGVGSAVNDTTREVGGALGVAVIGSLLTSSYAGDVAGRLSGLGLPDQAVQASERSLGAALQVADRIGGQAGQTVATAAREAFVSGMGRGVLVGAAVIGAGALVALAALPARSSDVQEPASEPALDAAAPLVPAEVVPVPA